MRWTLAAFVVSALLFATVAHAAVPALPQYSGRKDLATGFAAARDVAVADFNGDGKPDLVVSDGTVARVRVFPGDGTGNFGAGISTTVAVNNTYGLSSLSAGDINEDGKQDVIVTGADGLNSTYVLLGDGTGIFTQAPVGIGSCAKTWLIDLNRDKHLDFVCMSSDNGAPPIVGLGDGKGNFSLAHLASALSRSSLGFPVDFAFADFNRDDKLDIVASYWSVSSAWVAGFEFYAGRGDGTFASPVEQKKTIGKIYLSSGDFNTDGRTDVLTAAAGFGSILFGFGDGTFNLSPYSESALSLPDAQTNNFLLPPRILAFDMNGDRIVDAIAADPFNNILSVSLNDGTGNFLPQTVALTVKLAGKPGSLLAADINSDGVPDVLVLDTTNQQVSYILSPGRTTPTLTITGPSSPALLGNPVTVVVALSSKLPAGTGTITLLEGSTVLGTTTLVRRESSAPAGAIGNTSVSSLFQLSTLSAGTHSLTATYSGDTNYTPATAVSNLALTIADATVTLPTASQTIPAGGSATYAFNIAAVGGFNGSVAFTCSGLPTGYACGSSSVTVSGPTATASVTVSPLKAQQGPQPFGPAGIAIGTASVMFLWLGRRRLTGHLLVLVAMVSFTALSGCSSGSSSSTNTTSPGTPPATPVATNFTITATITLGSGTITRTVPATLIVQ